MTTRTARRWVMGVLAGVTVWLIAGAAPRQADRQPEPAPAAKPNRRGLTEPLFSNTKTLRDLEYARVNGNSLKLDLFIPKGDGKSKPSTPLIVWIHGGGWHSGSKDACPLIGATGQGYAVASINYRLTAVAIFPAQVYDCKAAIRWLRAHAAEYGYNADRIGVAGISAGGHLVALLGTSGGVKELEGDVGDNLKQSSSVQAVADFCGPAVFTGQFLIPEDADHRYHEAIVKLLGGPVRDNEAKARQASPSTYISKDDPPFIIFHGDKDPIVPVNQAQVFADMLTKAGVNATLHILKGGGHGVVNPETLRLTMAFFDKHIKHAPAAKTGSVASQPG